MTLLSYIIREISIKIWIKIMMKFLTFTLQALNTCATIYTGIIIKTMIIILMNYIGTIGNNIAQHNTVTYKRNDYVNDNNNKVLEVVM